MKLKFLILALNLFCMAANAIPSEGKGDEECLSLTRQVADDNDVELSEPNEDQIQEILTFLGKGWHSSMKGMQSYSKSDAINIYNVANRLQMPIKSVAVTYSIFRVLGGSSQQALEGTYKQLTLKQ